ncbi:MAG: DNA mismatch repair endonuclease MutL [bacterium]
MPIKILDDNLINKIAAGEVVERPASVVKELVENSLDAGADFITVEIKNGGIDLIDIIDNGKGMSKGDARLSVERHATSKIEKIEDLNNIMSFGFRGEALAAISSVSKFSLHTKEKGSVSGILLKRDYGTSLSECLIVENKLAVGRRGSTTSLKEEEKFEVQDIGCSEGTKIRVEDIFYNVPARKKFLKSVQTEFNHILNTLTDIALSNHNVRFKLVHNGRVVFDYLVNTQPDEKEDSSRRDQFEDEMRRRNNGWSERVKDILGKDNFNKLIPFYRESGEIVMHGFVSASTNASLTKSHQHLFVNNRPVYNNIVQRAIYNGYKNFIPSNSHPCFVIKLNLEPEEIDVNVHPRKMEVKFLHQQDVFKTVEAVVREAVGNSEKFRNLEIKKLDYNFASSENNSEIRNWKLEIGENFKKQNNDFKFQNEELAKAKSFSPPIKGLTPPLPPSRGELVFHSHAIKSFNNVMFRPQEDVREEASWKLMGQVKNLYLVVEAEDSLILIDQHATHERIIYDSIIEKIESANYKAQQLLVPLKIDLSLKEMEIIKQGFGILGKIGFEIEEFGVNTIIVQTVPQDIVGKDVKGIIKGIVNDFLMAEKEELEKGGEVLEKLRNKIVCYIACRTAIKQGDVLSLNEQMNLAKKVMAGEVMATCPHGRPIMSVFRWEEIGKRFKRN